jgi:hypothetical protein
MMGTHWEKSKEIPLPSPPQKFEKKNWTVHEGMLSLPIRCMKFLFVTIVVMVFCLARVEFWEP